MELTKAFVEEQVAKNYDYVVGIRRWMHEHPEVSGQEKETSAMVEEEIKKLGLPYEKAATYGWVATMECGGPGKTVALRADLDALPMPEDPENLKEARVCISKNEGAMHACGHDAHTAMLLGAMQILNGMKDKLKGTILFCFEEGEETGTGIEGMKEVLFKKKIDNVWGIHVYAPLESGKISIDAGPRMAGNSVLEFTLKGKGGHGSRPDLAINPLYAAAHTLVSMQNAWVNEIDVTKTVTLGVGKFQSGTQANIIPETAEVAGTLRFFDMEEGAKAKDIVKRYVEANAAMHRCEIVHMRQTLMSSCINDADASAKAEKALNNVLEPGTVVKCDPWYASESFSHYLNMAPGVLAFLGINNPEKGTGADHHNVKFDVDESVMKIGMASTVAYAVEILMGE